MLQNLQSAPKPPFPPRKIEMREMNPAQEPEYTSNPAILNSGLLLPFPKTCLLKLLPPPRPIPPLNDAPLVCGNAGAEDRSGTCKACL